MQANLAFLRVVVVVVVVGVTRAQPLPDVCCMPNLFFASLTDVTTIGDRIMTLNARTVDFDRQLEAVVHSKFDPSTRVITNYGKTVFNFKQGMMYFVPHHTADCIRTEINWSMYPRCIPGNAEYLGTTFLGLNGDLVYNAWRFTYGQDHDNMTISVTDRDCVPVIENKLALKVTFNGGQITPLGPKSTTFLFSNFIDSNVSTSVFYLPPSCTTAWWKRIVVDQ